MIKEALEYLNGLSRKAAEPKEIMEDDPRTDRYVIGGELVAIDRSPEPRDHHVKSLDDLIGLATRFYKGIGEQVVWFDEGKVVLVIDDDEHRVETATLTLEQSAVFTKLVELSVRKPWLNQKEFIRLLRIDLAGTGDPATRLLGAVRQVSFENGAVTAGRYVKDQESLGRTITSAVKSAAGDVPEDVALFVTPYSTQGADIEATVHCSVEIEPADGTFRLLPKPDELIRVQKFVMSSIRAILEEGLPEGLPAYYGRP